MNERSPPVSVPRISTDRLLLRELRTTDFDAYAANWADPASRAHHLGPVDRPTAWRMFSASTGAWMLNGFGWWAVENRATKDFVAIVGCFLRDGFPDLEIGWVVLRAHWRRGIATEAATAALAFGMQARRRVIAHIDLENAASIGVAERIGMRREGKVPFMDSVTYRYVRERDEARSA